MKNTYWNHQEVSCKNMRGDYITVSEKWVLVHNNKYVAEFRRKE